MCEYCGCRDIAIIGRLSEEHYGAIDALGELRRAIQRGAHAEVTGALDALAEHLFPHNDLEEAGLFFGLTQPDYVDYFGETVDDLKRQHVLLRDQVACIRGGDWDVYAELEHTLRRHIEQEENGLFPATAVSLDGETWDMIDELTHEFDHAHGLDHPH